MQLSPAQYDSLLQKHLDRKDVISIVRNEANGMNSFYGILLQFNRSFLLIQNQEDFRLDGFSIIRKDQFEGIASNSFTQTIRKILKAEGELDSAYGLASPLPLQNWNRIFTGLKAAGYHVIAEAEHEAEPGFWIGAIVKVNAHSVRVHTYDATGRLAAKPETIAFDRISKLTFGDRYSTTFRNYLRKK